MEKVCEFCRASRPVVHCQADAAQLCLSCDAKVHSANALSNRHPRTLVCEACRCHPAYVRCSNHRIFMCHGCDCSLHKDSSQHQKQLIRTYMGCPSAKDFAALWGFDLNELEDSTLQHRFVTTSCVSVDTGVPKDIPRQREFYPQTKASLSASQAGTVTSVPGAETVVGRSSQQTEVSREGKQQPKSCIILQQILDLEKLQLTEGDNNSSFIRGKQQSGVSLSIYDTSWKLDENMDESLQYPHGFGADPKQESNVELFSSPFSPSEHLSSSSTVGNKPLQGEPFWQCRSPPHSFQLWSQNMQDLGICEELACRDDFNMPEVDLTFRNYEELFGGDQDLIRAMLNDKDLTSSSVDKDTSLEGFNHDFGKEIEDASLASSVYISQSVNPDEDIGPSNQTSQCHRTEDCSRPIRPSFSTQSLSLSRFSAESNATDYNDRCYSPFIATQEPPSSPGQKSLEMGSKAHAVSRYKEKKKVRRHEKQIRYASRKARADAGSVGVADL